MAERLLSIMRHDQPISNSNLGKVAYAVRREVGEALLIGTELIQRNLVSRKRAHCMRQESV